MNVTGGVFLIPTVFYCTKLAAFLSNIIGDAFLCE